MNGKGESGFWVSVGGTLGVCRNGLRKDATDRIDAAQMEKEIRKWVDRGLGAGRRWCCGGENEEVIPGISFSSVAGADPVPPTPGEKAEDSPRSMSWASSDCQLPVERPFSMADTLSVDGTSVTQRKGECFDPNAIYIPEEEEEEEEEDWPIRRDLAPLPIRQKPSSKESIMEFPLPREATKPMATCWAGKSFYEVR